MNQRGSALLSALWLAVLLAATTASVFAGARLGAMATANRVALTRAAWAAEACLMVAQARYATSPELRPEFFVALGDGIGCRVEVEDPGIRVNVNLAGAGALGVLLGRAELTDALLDWRDGDDVPRPAGAEAEWYTGVGGRSPRNGPLASVEELAFVRGFDDSVLARVRPLLTVRGGGRVSLDAAPAAVLRSLPGFENDVVERILSRRAAGVRWAGAEELLHDLDPVARDGLAPFYQELLAMVQAEGDRFILVIEGGVAGAGAVYRMDVTVAPAGARLAVVAREVR